MNRSLKNHIAVLLFTDTEMQNGTLMVPPAVKVAELGAAQVVLLPVKTVSTLLPASALT